MSKKKTTKKITAKTKTSSGLQIKKDAKGRFWLVPADGGKEQGPYDTKKQAADAKAAPPAATDDAPPAVKGQRKAKAPKEPKVKRVSALDAAAQVLATSKEPMSSKEMILAMAGAGLWTSPGGKTPDATLYAAIIREISAKGKESRFKKTDRGRFAAAG